MRPDDVLPKHLTSQRARHPPPALLALRYRLRTAARGFFILSCVIAPPLVRNVLSLDLALSVFPAVFSGARAVPFAGMLLVCALVGAIMLDE